MLIGNKVYLSELRDGDTEDFVLWQWDTDFMNGISADVFHPFQAEDWAKMFAESDSNEAFYFTIRQVATDQVIGFVSLTEVLFKNRRAELGIGILNPEYRGKGYGDEAVRLILRYAFDHLGLHKVNLSVHAYNVGAIHLYEKIGFLREGVNREAIYRDGQWFDQYDYGFLQNEYRERLDK
ncbi:hypothetical protein CBF34_00700 [Vagococcus penaei]|uniref:Uncharacterized protein n=1 Tax=Vagococcus penaei TaxID=633807 RepID=A0A1Q2D5F7_9ENTE|nr:GNAT family protein [Vagococcus penaei]AQP53614.1 hypothetical protein BW732_04780 [Vagococcus penaei]RSU07559.1 hypothetical protein CBF34_00700 [Vagococcus penaei]